MYMYIFVPVTQLKRLWTFFHSLWGPIGPYGPPLATPACVILYMPGDHFNIMSVLCRWSRFPSHRSTRSERYVCPAVTHRSRGQFPQCASKIKLTDRRSDNNESDIFHRLTKHLKTNRSNNQNDERKICNTLTDMQAHTSIAEHNNAKRSGNSHEYRLGLKLANGWLLCVSYQVILNSAELTGFQTF